MGGELDCIEEVLKSRHVSGDGVFTKRCNEWIEGQLGRRTLLTTSCTHALEMAAMLCGINPGDEVIMPSYTFVSTADAFVLRGANIVFVDIRPDTMNINERLIEAAITPRTKAIVAVHYAGVGCEMDAIMQIAKAHAIFVVEDAAQSVMARYKGCPLGGIGDFGCFSFHETKNYSMGEGGAIIIRNAAAFEQAEIIREKGTDRSRFYRGQVDKYTWIEAGSSYLPSDLNAAYLYPQLQQAEMINEDRLNSWHMYHALLEPLAKAGHITCPTVPEDCMHNAHMYYIKTAGLDERTRLLAHLNTRGIGAVFHYVPLHSAAAGQRFGRFHGEDVYTTKESERLIRLPMYYGLYREDLHRVVQAVFDFYGISRNSLTGQNRGF